MTKERVSKQIETIANIAIIAAAAVLILVSARNYIGGRKPAAPSIAVGAKLAVEGVSWQSSEKTVVFAISTNCPYCTASAGFYRTLVSECRRRHVRTIAILPQPLNEAQSYLVNEGVEVDEIKQGALADLKINGTPTLVLVDHAGIVRSVWFGELPRDGEQEVLSRVGS